MSIITQAGPMTRLHETHTKTQIDRLFLISLKRSYVFCPISKVANSSIKGFLFEAEFRANGMAHMINTLNTGSIHDTFYGPLIVPAQLPNLMLNRILTGDRYFKFVFVRNPIDRLVSCYLDRVLTPTSVPHKTVLNGLGLKEGHEIKFEEFVDFISSQKIKEMNPHWKPQYYECAYEFVKYDEIYHFENLSESIKDVLQRLYPGVAENIDTSKNYSPAKTSATARRSELVTPEIAQKIYKTFEIDFETFGYALPSAE